MSPSGTMTRVHQAVKARVMAGAFAPGERIDPARLSPELGASATPIREALHRLAGERLVESWQQEGFRQPFVTEASLRDLYGWSEDLLRIVLRAAERNLDPMQPPDLAGSDLASTTAVLFEWFALHSPNLEHRLAITSLNERSHAVRLIEETLLPASRADLREIADSVLSRHWADARRLVAQYHAVRHRRVPELAASFRTRQA